MSKALDPIFQFLRVVAPLAWVPIALAALRQNEPAALFVIFITAIWPILINTSVGVRQIPSDYNNVAKVLQLSKKNISLIFLFPLLSLHFHRAKNCTWLGLVGDYCSRNCYVRYCWDWLLYLECLSE
jgi:bicarbonate transport system permease protein